ncbi:unnamed protein product [Lampetra fluviatilis]
MKAFPRPPPPPPLDAVMAAIRPSPAREPVLVSGAAQVLSDAFHQFLGRRFSTSPCPCRRSLLSAVMVMDPLRVLANPLR